MSRIGEDDDLTPVSLEHLTNSAISAVTVAAPNRSTPTRFPPLRLITSQQQASTSTSSCVDNSSAGLNVAVPLVLTSSATTAERHLLPPPLPPPPQLGKTVDQLQDRCLPLLDSNTVRQLGATSAGGLMPTSSLDKTSPTALNMAGQAASHLIMPQPHLDLTTNVNGGHTSQTATFSLSLNPASLLHINGVTRGVGGGVIGGVTLPVDADFQLHELHGVGGIFRPAQALASSAALAEMGAIMADPGREMPPPPPVNKTGLPHPAERSLSLVEESIITDLWCQDCSQSHPGDCPQHGCLSAISDTLYECRAKMTLPRQLTFKPSLAVPSDIGVWADVEIARRTRFGPVEGVLTPYDKARNSDPPLVWKIFHQSLCYYFVDASGENVANWMRYVRRARTKSEQNLVAYQRHNAIYFATIKDIAPGNELLFWFSKDYAIHLGVTEVPETAYKCAWCDKTFPSDRHLVRHTNQCHPNFNQRKHWCISCGRTFASSSKLKVHELTHKGEKPHKCTHCSKAFTDKSNLRMHLSIHTGIRDFKCSLCQKTFRQKAHLTSHMVTHSGSKTIKCQYCDKMFSRKSDMKQHTYVHTKEKEVKCEVCSKVFWRPQSLSKHMRSHSKRCFACAHCRKEFLTGYHLQRHSKICKGAKKKARLSRPPAKSQLGRAGGKTGGAFRGVAAAPKRGQGSGRKKKAFDGSPEVNSDGESGKTSGRDSVENGDPDLSESSTELTFLAQDSGTDAVAELAADKDDSHVTFGCGSQVAGGAQTPEGLQALAEPNGDDGMVGGSVSGGSSSSSSSSTHSNFGEAGGSHSHFHSEFSSHDSLPMLFSTANLESSLNLLQSVQAATSSLNTLNP